MTTVGIPDKVPELIPMSTDALSPSCKNPRTMASLTASSNSLCAARRMGRAPNSAAFMAPSFMMESMRDSDTVSVIDFSLNARSIDASTIAWAISRRFSSSNGEKTMISSILLRSSGFISCWSSSWTISESAAYSCAAVTSVELPFVCSSTVSSPMTYSSKEVGLSSPTLLFFFFRSSPPPPLAFIRRSNFCCPTNSNIFRLPTLEVMTRMTFLKLIALPFPSVRIPSSITCSNTFNTSLCAFSISSNNTTE
mmetsp:Transcript_18956/g.41047  ORF Transcript_18956/g.41047 Transcript_18956/m.41047 type:complete len:252 (-) Transcript_18956:717-1472(-)